jgi:hypothetical protein
MEICEISENKGINWTEHLSISNTKYGSKEIRNPFIFVFIKIQWGMIVRFVDILTSDTCCFFNLDKNPVINDQRGKDGNVITTNRT